MNYKYCLLATLLLFFASNTYSNKANTDGYKIKIMAPHQKGDMAYLSNYWMGNPYIIDSVMVPSDGKLTFGGDKSLPTGQYLLYIKPKVQIDLLIDGNEQQDIQIDLSDTDLTKSKVKGSKDTKILWKYLTEFHKTESEKEKYSLILKDLKKDDKALTETVVSYEKAMNAQQKFIDSFVAKYKNTWGEAFIQASRPLLHKHAVVTTPEELSENKAYVAEHFFDYVNLKDARLWSTNFFTGNINTYLDEWIPQYIDTIAYRNSWLVSQTEGNEESFEKMLSFLNNQAMQSKAMGMENVWAKLTEDYIFDKNISWINSEQYNALKKEYALIEHNRMGMTAQNMELNTIEGDTINTSQIESEFTLLYFYSPSCGHCATEVPLLKTDFYDKYKDKLHVVAINIERDIDQWKSFIAQHDIKDWTNAFDPNYTSQYWIKYNVSGTPSLYLLDKNKKIVAKKLDVKTLITLFERIK